MTPEAQRIAIAEAWSETAPSPARLFCRFCGHGPLFSWELSEPSLCKICARDRYEDHEELRVGEDDADEDAKNWTEGDE